MELFHNIYSKKHIYQLNSYEEDQEIISNVVEQISKQIGIRLISDPEQSKIRRQLGKFDSFKEYPIVALFDAYLIEHSHSFKLLILTTNSTIDRIVHRNQINRETIVEHEFVGLVQLNKNYAHTYIRPETISDKINEWFNPVEIDFDIDKKFSRKYYVLTSDEQTLRGQVSQQFLNSISNYNGLEIEILNSTLMVRNRNRISQKSAFKIVNFLGRICNGDN